MTYIPDTTTTPAAAPGPVSTPTYTPQFDLTAGEVISATAVDLRQAVLGDGGDSAEDTKVLLSLLNRVYLDALERTQWKFLQSPPYSFTTIAGQSLYYIGDEACPDGVADTSLQIPDVDYIDKESVRNLTKQKPLALATTVPLGQNWQQEGEPTLCYVDTNSVNVLGLYPPPKDAYTMEFRYYARPDELTGVEDLVQWPRKYRYALIDGLTARMFEYLKQPQEARDYFGLYEKGLGQVVRQMNLSREQYDFIKPGI